MALVRLNAEYEEHGHFPSFNIPVISSALCRPTRTDPNDIPAALLTWFPRCPVSLMATHPLNSFLIVSAALQRSRQDCCVFLDEFRSLLPESWSEQSWESFLRLSYHLLPFRPCPSVLKPVMGRIVHTLFDIHFGPTVVPLAPSSSCLILVPPLPLSAGQPSAVASSSPSPVSTVGARQRSSQSGHETLPLKGPSPSSIQSQNTCEGFFPPGGFLSSTVTTMESVRWSNTDTTRPADPSSDQDSPIHAVRQWLDCLDDYTGRSWSPTMTVRLCFRLSHTCFGG